MKFTKKDDSQLRDSMYYWLGRVRSLRNAAIDPSASIENLEFTDRKLTLLYEVFVWKFQSRSRELQRRQRASLPYADKQKMAWKLFWKKRKSYTNWNLFPSWSNRDRNYQYHKQQFKSRFYKRPLYSGTTRKFGRSMPLYKQWDPVTNKYIFN